MRTYKGQKAGLTRAQNKGPKAVLLEVRRTVAEWDGQAWPDDWHRWNIAWSDAVYALARDGEDVHGLPMTIDSFEVVCGMVRYR